MAQGQATSGRLDCDTSCSAQGEDWVGPALWWRLRLVRFNCSLETVGWLEDQSEVAAVWCDDRVGDLVSVRETERLTAIQQSL